MSGFKGATYPEDLSGQQAMLRPLVEPIVALVLGPGAKYEVYPRRGQLRNSTLPLWFRFEAARLSRAKHEGLAAIYFNPCITLATR